MKKIISMLAVLCMLITSVPMVVSADETANEVTGFTKADRAVYIDIEDNTTKIKSKDGNNDGIWSAGTNDLRTAQNGTKYLQFDTNREWWAGTNTPRDNGTYKKAIKPEVYNQKKLTVETWLSIDVIDQAYVNIFATTKPSHWNLEGYEMWQLYVENGVLKHRYNDQVLYSQSLTQDNMGKFMHLVITRDVQNDKIVLSTIINGQQVNTITLTEDIDTLLKTPEGGEDSSSSAFWLMGTFRNGNQSKKICNFGGRLGEFNIYHDVMTQDQAATLYNRDKEKYNFEAETAYLFQNNEIFFGSFNNYVSNNFDNTFIKLNKERTYINFWPVGYNNNNFATGTSTVNGKKFKYVDNSPKASSLFSFGEDSENRSGYDTSLLKVMKAEKDMTIEAWVSVNDVLRGNTTDRRKLFYLGKSGTAYKGTGVIWEVYVQDGKIKQAYNDTTVANEIDITALAGQFIHVLATRKVDSANSKIAYDLYVNGTKATTCERAVESTVCENPNYGANIVWFGGAMYYTTGASIKDQFVGKMAEINVYDKAADDNEATALYNKGKDTYSIGTDTESVEYYNNMQAVSAFRKGKVVWLDKDYTDGGKIIKYSEGNTANWYEKTPKKATMENSSGYKITYLDYTDGANHFNGGNTNDSTHTFLNKILKQDKTTVETWLSVDDILTGRADTYRNIFHFTESYRKYADNTTWKLFVQNGQLRQTYNGTNLACDDISLHGYEGQFVHVVASRELTKDDAGNITKITYQTYFNGEAQKPVVVNAPEGEYLTLSAEEAFFIGGSYGASNVCFKGKIAEFNMYQNTFDANTVSQIYNAEKSTYTLAVPEKTDYEVFKSSKSLTLDKTGEHYLKVTDVTLPSDPNDWYWEWNKADITTGVNKDGEEYEYYPFVERSDKNAQGVINSNYFGADKLVKKLSPMIIGRKNLTIEMWISIDDIMDTKSGYKQIFYTGPKDNYSARNGNWRLVVEGGKLKHEYKDQTIDEIDLTNYKEEFVHVVLTRDVNNDSVAFNTYFNGEKQTGKNVTVDTTSVAALDGVAWAFGGGWNLPTANQFVGKMADMSIYHMTAEDAFVASLYNETKETYASEHTIKVTEMCLLLNDDNETTITDLSQVTTDEIYVSGTLKNTSSRLTKNAIVVAALYKGNKLVAMSSGTIEIEANGEKYSNLEITVPKKSDGSYDLDSTSKLKVFVWSTDEGETMKPYKVEEDVDMAWGYTARQGN